MEYWVYTGVGIAVMSMIGRNREKGMDVMDAYITRRGMVDPDVGESQD